jgi:SAM-dependent methyltransferase
MPRIIFNRCDYLADLVRGKKVLDIGCVEHSFENSLKKGSRWLHRRIKENAASVLGLDYETAEVIKMQQAGYNVCQANAESFDLNDKFDLIMAGELLEHLSNPGKFLECALRHLNDGGQLVITTPNANCMIYFLENLLLGREIDNADHCCLYSPVTISTLLSRHGFKVEKHVFVAENTAYHHVAIMAKILIGIKQIFQVPIGWIQPSMCHHMITIASVKHEA